MDLRAKDIYYLALYGSVSTTNVEGQFSRKKLLANLPFLFYLLSG